MINRHSLAAVVCLSALGLFAIGSLASDWNFSPRASEAVPLPSLPALAQADFGGTLRVYIVEPVSRWRDANNQTYKYGFIDFALDSPITLNVGERVHLSKVWDASSSGFSGFDSSNIMAIAVMFDDEPHQKYSYPPSAHPFYAYYVEGAAYARPGFCDSNNTTGNSTHTVFVEEGTATWCGYCPAVNYYLHAVYNSGNYNFIYTALVDDRNNKADRRLTNDYNVYGFPTSYYDGGDGVLVGGPTGTSTYISYINSSANRAVQGVGLMVKVEWLGVGGGDLQIDVAFALGTPINSAPVTEMASGEAKPLVGESYEYVTSGTDAEGDELWHQFDWGNGEVSAWVGPHDPSEPCLLSHAWSETGSYEVRVRSRDAWMAESDWSAPLAVMVGCCVLPGDVSDDGAVNVGDLTYLVNHLFRGGPVPPCPEHGDVNGDGANNVGDLTYLVNNLFRGGPAPAACE